MKKYKTSLVLGTSLVALSIFMVPLSAKADDVSKPQTCYTTDSSGNPDTVVRVEDEIRLCGTKPIVDCPADEITPDPVDDREGGGDGGGDGCCFFAGTQVLMADGTLKAIETIEEGDVTIFGKVHQKLARYYDRSHQHNRQNECIFYKGVYVTGHHVSFTGEEWVEAHDLMGAIPSQPPCGGEQTFNLVTEERIIPVMGNSGLIYFADNLNNVGRVSEYSLKMMQENHKQAA